MNKYDAGMKFRDWPCGDKENPPIPLNGSKVMPLPPGVCKWMPESLGSVYIYDDPITREQIDRLHDYMQRKWLTPRQYSFWRFKRFFSLKVKNLFRKPKNDWGAPPKNIELITEILHPPFSGLEPKKSGFLSDGIHPKMEDDDA